jgi:ABC-2 type transport system permease protein
MRDFFREIWQLTKREIDIISGDGSIILTIFIAPLLYMLLLGTIYMKKDIHSVDMAVIDMDRTQLSRTYIRFIESTEKAHVKYMPENIEESKDLFYRFKVFGVLVIPEGFGKNVMTLKGSDVTLYLNNSRFLMSNEINKAVQKVSLMLGAGLRLKYFEETGTNPREAMEIVMPVKPEINFMYDIFNNYGYFLLPGLLLLILQQTLVVGLGESISIERQENLLPQWLKPSISIFTSVAGKNLFYFVLYMAYSLLVFAVLFPFYKLPVKGNPLDLALLMALFITAMLLFTNLLASFFKKQLLYMEIIAFTSYPIFLVTGYTFPRYALPDVYVWFSYILPTTPFMETLIKISQQNATIKITGYNYLILTVQIIVLYILLHLRLKYLKNRLHQASI